MYLAFLYNTEEENVYYFVELTFIYLMWKNIYKYLPDEILAIIGRTGCHATSRSSSPFVPWRIFTRFPILFSQIYKACCRAEPAQIYSPSPEKQHFFHIVLNNNNYEKKSVINKENGTYLLTRSCSFWIGSGSPSLPQAKTSLLSYTLITRSAVFTRKQLQKDIKKTVHYWNL